MTRFGHDAGTTLLGMLIYLSIGAIALSAAFLLWGAERMASRADEQVFRASAAVSETLEKMGEDARVCAKAVPRHRGVGALFFFPDGSVAVWFDRGDEPGAVHRKVVRPDGTATPDRVVARGVESLGVESAGRLVTVRAVAGNEDREMTVRRRP